MLSLNVLHILGVAGLTLMAGSLLLSFSALASMAWLDRRDKAALEAEMATAGVDPTDAGAVNTFTETSPAAGRLARSPKTFGRMILGCIIAALVFAIVGGLGMVLHENAYRSEVRVTLAEAYDVAVDHRSLDSLPRANEVVSAGLVLRHGDQNAQCTVATGTSPADLTVICGGRELRPRR